MSVRKRPQARRDLLDIWVHIATDSPLRADQFLDFLYGKIRLLATSPRMGRLYMEVSDDLRGFPIQDYLVFYREAIDGIEVIRVLHGARDIEAIFDDS